MCIQWKALVQYPEINLVSILFNLRTQISCCSLILGFRFVEYHLRIRSMEYSKGKGKIVREKRVVTYCLLSSRKTRRAPVAEGSEAWLALPWRLRKDGKSRGSSRPAGALRKGTVEVYAASADGLRGRRGRFPSRGSLQKTHDREPSTCAPHRRPVCPASPAVFCGYDL